MPLRSPRRPGHLPAEDPAIGPRARGAQPGCGRAGRCGQRPPLLFALALCLFLVVGVPILVLATMPGVHADDAGAPPGDTVAIEANSDPDAGEQLAPQPDAQDSSTPAPEPTLADATADAQQVLATTQPAEPGANQEPGADQHDSGGLPQTTPNLALLRGQNPTRPREPTPGDYDSTGDGGGEGTGEADGTSDRRAPPAGAGDQVPRPTLTLELALDDQAPEGTRPDPTGTSAHDDQALAAAPVEQVEQPGPATRPGQDTDPTSLVIAPGDPTRLRATDAGLPTINGLRIQPGPNAFGAPGKPMLLVRLVGTDRLRAGADTPVPLPGAQPGPGDGSVLLLDPAALGVDPAALGVDPAALGVDPAALAAALAGWGPITVAPTPTSGDSLEPFLRTVWEQREGIYTFWPTVQELWRSRAQHLPPGRHLLDYPDQVRRLSPNAFVDLRDGGRQPLNVVTRRLGDVGMGDQGYWFFDPRAAEESWRGRYGMTVNTSPAHTLDVTAVVVREFVEGPEGGVPATRITGPLNSRTLRGSIDMVVRDLPALNRLVLRMGELSAAHPHWFVDDTLPMADRILPGVGITVRRADQPFDEPFGGSRTEVISDALVDTVDAAYRAQEAGQEAPEDFDAFRRLVHERLRANGVSPDAPHTQPDALTFSPERRVWLQARGSAIGGYHLGGPRSPAATGAGAGSGLGLLLGGGSILLDRGGHPHAVRDLTVATGVGAVGGYLGGQLEFVLNAHLAPVELTAANAPLGIGLRGMVLPRMVSGGVTGALTAPLITWGILGIDEVVFGADHPGSDYAALGARSATGGAAGGGAGAGAAALTIYLLGGASAGLKAGLLGGLAGLAGGLIVYLVVDGIWGDKVERSVRTAVGDHGPEERTARK
jgi:hypothetical protein